MKDKKIELSVIIPVYRPNKAFEECIESLSIQNISKERFEILCILNGPKDGYEAFVKLILNNSVCNYQYIYTDVANVSNARNLGIENAKGEYITFIDSDDKISPDYLSELLLISQNNKLGLANLLCFTEEDNYFPDYLSSCFQKGKNKKHLSFFSMRSFFSTPVCKVIHKSLISDYKFNTKYNYGEDALFMFSIVPILPREIELAKCGTYLRRVASGSLSRGREKKEVRRIYYHLIGEYIKLYFNNISKYNILFFLSRIVACIVHIITGF